MEFFSLNFRFRISICSDNVLVFPPINYITGLTFLPGRLRRLRFPPGAPAAPTISSRGACGALNFLLKKGFARSKFPQKPRKSQNFLKTAPTFRQTKKTIAFADSVRSISVISEKTYQTIFMQSLECYNYVVREGIH